MQSKTVTLVAMGTQGDVQPYIALGKGLQTAGFHVRLATTINFRSLITQHGLEFHRVADVDIQTRMQDEDVKAVLETKNPVKLLRGIFELNRPWFLEALDGMLTAIDGADVAVLSPLAQFGGYEACEIFGIPPIFTHLQPVLPMQEVPSPFFPALPAVPGQTLYNRLTHHIVLQLIWQMFRPLVNDARVNRLGLDKLPLTSSWTIIKQRNLPVIMEYSRHIVPPSSNWHAAIHVSGYWFLDTPQAWSPPQALAAFLANGEAPIYIGFGSMSNRDPDRTTEIVVNALQQTGERAVLASGWGGLDVGALPDNLFRIESCPHSWLFPRMKAIVHHGGAGTTAAAFRAGKPQIVVPFFADQPFWGRMTYQHGVGVKPIPHKKLSVESLAGAIHQAANSDEMQRNATELGQKINAEDGVGNAVAIVKRTTV